MGLLGWSQSAAAEYAGYVLQVRGHWYASGTPQRDLTASDTVEQGATIRSRPPFEISDAIVIIGRKGEELAKRSCGEGEACQAPIVLPAGPARDEPLVRLVAAVMQRWRGEEARFTSLEERGGKLRLYEGVVALHLGRTDLTAVAGDLPAGAFTLEWRALAQPASGAGAPRRYPFERVAGAPATTAVPDLEPGLYELVAHAGAAAGAGPERACEAWVLAVSEASYPEAAASFQKVVTLASAWAADTSSDTSRRFLRAALLELASSAAAARP